MHEQAYELAEALFAIQQEGWDCEWRKWQAAHELVTSCDPGTLRQVCVDVLDTSHRNVKRWAQNWLKVKDLPRHPEHSPRWHLTKRNEL